MSEVNFRSAHPSKRGWAKELHDWLNRMLPSNQKRQKLWVLEIHAHDLSYFAIQPRPGRKLAWFSRIHISRVQDNRWRIILPSSFDGVLTRLIPLWFSHGDLLIVLSIATTSDSYKPWGLYLLAQIDTRSFVSSDVNTTAIPEERWRMSISDRGNWLIACCHTWTTNEEQKQPLKNGVFCQQRGWFVVRSYERWLNWEVVSQPY